MRRNLTSLMIALLVLYSGCIRPGNMQQAEGSSDAEGRLLVRYSRWWDPLSGPPIKSFAYRIDIQNTSQDDLSNIVFEVNGVWTASITCLDRLIADPKNGNSLGGQGAIRSEQTISVFLEHDNSGHAYFKDARGIAMPAAVRILDFKVSHNLGAETFRFEQVGPRDGGAPSNIK